MTNVISGINALALSELICSFHLQNIGRCPMLTSFTPLVYFIGNKFKQKINNSLDIRKGIK